MLEARAIRRAEYGADHPRVAEVEVALGAVERLGGDATAAREHYTAALAIRQASTPEHPEVEELRRVLAELEGKADSGQERGRVGEQGEVPTGGADVGP